MNPIQKAVDEVKWTIPRAVLEKAFVDRQNSWRMGARKSLDEQIISLVIRPRVLVDCNLIGGTQALISLNGLPQEKPTEYLTVIHIPKERTEGKSINSVLNVGFVALAYLASWAGMNAAGSLATYGSSENTALMTATAGMLTAFDKIPMVSTARVELIAENSILIRDSINLYPDMTLRCVLANEENLNNLQLRAYRNFAELVGHAVKAYIYNTLIINMDQGELQGGQELGVFKETVLEYRDSNQNYLDYLRNTWEAVSLMQDEQSYLRFMKLIIGGNR